jgi:hypothetical protein
VRWYARIPLSAFRDEGRDPDDFPRFCDVIGHEVDVSLSRAGRDCVTRLRSTDHDRYIVLALPFAEANEQSRRRGGPYRIWATDFALLEGAETEADVDRWLRREGIEIDSSDFGTLNRPAEAPRWPSG